MKRFLSYFTLAFLAFLSALNYEIFVFPNSFAPAGINGLCTIFMKISGINIGYLSLLINIPLALIVYFKVSKSVAVRTMVHVVFFSVSAVLLSKIKLPFYYHTADGSSKILGALTAGVIMGCIYSLLIRAGSYTGGMDFVSLIINKYNKDKSVFYITFIINSSVAFLSFFVYDYKIEPVLLCILYSFASSTTADKAMRAGRSAMRFEIITEHSEEILNEIISKLHHSATVINATGGFSGKNTKTVICIINKCQITALYEILKKYPGTFAVMDPVSEVLGNFKQISKDGKESIKMLDDGKDKSF